MIDYLISVIMPAYNAQKFIAESIESVINQTWINWELIIVDDGSTDNTADVIKKYRSSDARIKYFYQQNCGQGEAKNTAIRNSKGDFIAFLDSDDLWCKEKLEISLKEITSGDYSLVFTDCYLFKDQEKNSSNLTSLGVNNDIYNGRSSILMFLYCNIIPNLTVLVKKKALLDAGEFTNLKVAEDYEMWLRLLKNGCTFKSISVPLSFYRIHDDSLTAKDRHATYEVIKIIKEFGVTHPEYNKDAQKLTRDKIKYWLYNSSTRTNQRFRLLVYGTYSRTLAALFFILSFILPIDQLRKIVIRIG